MKKLVFILAVIGLVSCNGAKKEVSSVSSGKDTTISQKPMIFETTEEETEADNDSEVSGNASLIKAITKSIAEGDAKKLASMTSYPIARKYPLRDIEDSEDMVKRFNQLFDQKFCNRMKSSKSSDWNSYGYRGYSLGDDMVLWVYDSLTAIDYYSPQEIKLYNQLVREEMNSLHSSLRGNGWIPFCCYEDLDNGSTIRVDIRSRKVVKKENFHLDGPALQYPQLQPFKVRGDEEFRISIYPKGNGLSEKPQTSLIGFVEISGSANMMTYVFKDGKGMVITFGDTSYEDGMPVLNIKKGKEEVSHKIATCYWLDLVK